MYIRKIAAAAGFACGAALAFAPLAQADPSDFAVTTLDSEISSLNGLFQFDALLSGVSSTDYAPSGVGGLDTIALADVAKDVPTSGTASTLDYLLYGSNPFDAGVSSDSGAFNELNGALVQFDNAYNVEVYSAANGGLDTNLSDYIYNGTIQNVLATSGETPTQAFDTLYNAGIGDLSGYFQTDLSSFEIATAPAAATAASGFDITSTLTSEINGLNSVFASDVAAAGIDSSKIIEGTGPLPFDTILTADATDSLNSLLFGAASASGDPGSYDVFNGALTEFFNASNVGLFALLNAGDVLPTADLFGPADFLGDGVTTAIGEYLQLGFNDLLGYFIPAVVGSL